MDVFIEIVKTKKDDHRENLTWLINYATGDAKEMPKNCIQLPVEIGFETAQRLFPYKYGGPNRITAAYTKEIKLCSQIKAGNADIY